MIWKKKKFWGTLVAVALLAFCVKDISLTDLHSLSVRIDYIYLIPATVCTFLYSVFKALRWRLMVKTQKTIPAWNAITLYSAGQVINVVMPALTGQLGRILLFARAEGLRKTFVFSTIVLEVLLDAITLVAALLLTSLAFAIPDRYRTAGYIIGLVTLVLIGLLYLLLHYEDRAENFGGAWCRARWPKFHAGMQKSIRSFTSGMELLRSSQNVCLSLGLSFLYWGAHIFVVYFLFLAFGFGLPFSAAAMVMVINTLALMVPITPGNAGTFEVAVSTALLAFRVARPDAVLFALALHLLDLLPLWLLGMWFLRTEKVSLKDIREQHEDRLILDEMDERGSLIEREDPR
ncbi:MAG TPA: lysylphosphatidylglycerol synthase transmembrane domain-containing protein [candidate division Zixibacteria bacterium]|nr:lysylphosphatidylglycerol synthase transmembrane domain-containing protein [candidate division Zixibacteria bacterium]